MFVLLPEGYEVVGAGVATMISNVISAIYFVLVFRKLQNSTVLTVPHKLIKITTQQKRSLYSVGIPAAFAIFLFDLVFACGGLYQCCDCGLYLPACEDRICQVKGMPVSDLFAGIFCVRNIC